MKIGILIAMQKEFSLIKELLQEEQMRETNAYKYIIGKIGKHEIIGKQFISIHSLWVVVSGNGQTTLF